MRLSKPGRLLTTGVVLAGVCTLAPAAWAQAGSAGSPRLLANSADISIPESPPSNGFSSEPVVAANADGRLEAFAVGNDAVLYHTWQVSSGGWSGWFGLPGMQVQGPPAVGRNADERLEVFDRDSNSNLVHIWQTTPSGGWSGWWSLASCLCGAPAVARNTDGRLEVFAVDGQVLAHIWQTAPNSGWSGLTLFPQDVNALKLTGIPAVGTNADGRLEAFAAGAGNGPLYHIWQTTPGGGWSGFDNLGGQLPSSPAVGANQDGRLEVFYTGTSQQLYHLWQTSSGWSGHFSLGGQVIGTPTVARNADGRLEVFVLSTSRQGWHIWQTAPGAGWSGFANLGGPAGGFKDDLWLTSNADGRLEAFGTGMDNLTYHVWQVCPGCGWNGAPL